MYNIEQLNKFHLPEFHDKTFKMLDNIRLELKDLRNKKNEIKLNETLTSQEQILKLDTIRDKLRELRQVIEAVDCNRIDGSFVDENGEIISDQFVLKSLFDECLMLIFEISIV